MSGDIIYLQTADGNKLFVPDKEVKFLAYGNFGAPPVNFITRKGYKQHGATEVDYLLEPRTISVELWHSPACSRQEYWDNRLALHEFIRHNRNGPLQFVLRQPNGNKRVLTVRANPGMQFQMQSPTDGNDWNIDEPIDFIAFNPVWFDPVEHDTFLPGSMTQDLIFPITFPIMFGSTHVTAFQSITYTGTWKSYPTLVVYGPYTSVNIRNIETGVAIGLSIAIGGGDSRTITLTPGEQSVRDALGMNRFGDLSPTSDLVDFNIRPDPEVINGQQTIVADFVGGIAGGSALQVSYYDQYFAL